MAEILSQEEINALLSSLPTEQPDGAEPGKHTDERLKHVKVYDFRHPDKFSKVQLHVLQIIHENLARILTTTFSVQLRANTQFSVASVEQKTYEEFTRGLQNPTTMLIFSLDPLEGNCVWEMSPTTTFLIFDRLLGGTAGSFVDEERELTEIERTVIKKVGQRMLDVLKDSWHTIVEFSPALESIENNPEFTQIVSPSEVVIVVTLDVLIGEAESTMNICLPYLVLKPVSPRLSTQIWYATGVRQKSGTAHKSTEVIKGNLAQTNLELAVELGKTNIKIRDFLELKEGDALRLDKRTNGALQVKIGSTTKFFGKAGIIGKMMAVKIDSIADNREANYE